MEGSEKLHNVDRHWSGKNPGWGAYADGENLDVYKLFEYDDYGHYITSQIKANLEKVNCSWVQESDIKQLCSYITENNIKHKNIICHGTRRGMEQKYFKKFLRGIEYVIGTEISPNANDFEDTVEHDFHEAKEEWNEMFDVVYTNSWDHSYDYNKSLNTWIDSLVTGGYLFIEWSVNSVIDAGNESDPFSASFDVTQEILSKNKRVEQKRPVMFESTQGEPSNAFVEKYYFILKKV